MPGSSVGALSMLLEKFFFYALAPHNGVLYGYVKPLFWKDPTKPCPCKDCQERHKELRLKDVDRKPGVFDADFLRSLQ
jgi:hypothetical protein